MVTAEQGNLSSRPANVTVDSGIRISAVRGAPGSSSGPQQSREGRCVCHRGSAGSLASLAGHAKESGLTDLPFDAPIPFAEGGAEVAQGDHVAPHGLTHRLP